MENTKILFVPYELAVTAKEKGFNEPCFCYHLWDGTDLNKEFKGKLSNPLYIPKTNTEFSESKHIGAPLYQQLIDWFREEKKLQIELTCWYGTSYWKFEIYKVGNNNRTPEYNLFPCDWSATNDYHKTRGTSSIYTYYKALNKALEESFKLI